MANTMILPLQISRQYGASLDADYAFPSLEKLKEYVQSALSYSGQILYCKENDTLYKVNTDKTDVSELGGATASDVIVAYTPDEANALQTKENRNKIMVYMGNSTSSYIKGEMYYLHWNAITIDKFCVKGGYTLEIDYDFIEEKYVGYSSTTMTFKAEYKKDTTNVTNRWFCTYSGGTGDQLKAWGINIVNGYEALGDVINLTYTRTSATNTYTWKPLFVKPQRYFSKDWWLVNKIATYGGKYDYEFTKGHCYQLVTDVNMTTSSSGNIVVSVNEEQYKKYFTLHNEASFTYNANTGCFKYRYGMNSYEDARYTIEYLNNAGITWTGEIADGNSIYIKCSISDNIDDYYWKDLENEVEGDAGHIELTQSEYDALSEDEKMNGAIYFITDAEGDENNVKDFYYKTLPTEPLVFSQGMVSIRKDEATGLAYEYLDESSANRLKTDEYIHCNDLYYEINVPSEYTLMTRTYIKDDDGNMVALTNIPEFNGARTIKDIIYCRFTAPNALATQEEVLEHYRQNNLYFKFCLKRLDNADFTPETNEVVVLKYTEDYLYNSIYYDYNRQIKNMTADNELYNFITLIVEQPDFDGTLVLPRKTYLLGRAITIDTSKIKVFDGNNSEFIMTADNRAVFEITGSLDNSMSANPNTLNTEIMNNEPNTIIRNCIIRGTTNEDDTYKNNGIGIVLSGAIKTKIENCYIHHMATGIKLTNVCRDISICNNHIYAITGNGISLEDTNIHQLNINSNFITYCMNCVYVKPKELANLQINGNDIEISTYPTGYENARCLNFDISSTSNSCFEIEICGNTIQGHSASGNLIQFLGGTNPIQNVSIVGNHISNSNGTGIVLQDCKGFTIQGNTIKGIAGYIYDLRGTVSYTNIQGNVGSENCNNVITAPASAVLEHIAYVDNITTGSTTSVLATQKTDVVIQLEANDGKAYTKLEELGLTADATLDDAIAKLKGGQNATLSTKEFTNYQTLFPYSEEQDAFSSVRIEKSFDTSRTIVTWVRKDGSKVAYGNLSSNNKVVSWHQYALRSYVDSKIADLQAQIDALKS